MVTRAGGARKTRWRAGRTPSRDDDPRGKVPAGGVEWAGPSRRARLVAVLIAVALAAITFAVVSRVWRQAAPPPRPMTVEVRLVATPAVVAPAPANAPAPAPVPSR